MGAPSDYVIDPIGGSDITGTGVLGNEWKTPAHALVSIPRNAVDGDAIHTKTDPLGVGAVLPTPLSLVGYGTPTASAPLLWRGFTNTLRDGGQGQIDAGGTNPIFSIDYGNMLFVDMKLHNSTSFTMLTVLTGCSFLRCEFTGASRALTLRAGSTIAECYFHDNVISGIRPAANGPVEIVNCFFKGAAGFGGIGNGDVADTTVSFNIFSGASVELFGSNITCNNNSFWGDGGVIVRNSPGIRRNMIHSNVFSDIPGTCVVSLNATNSILLLGQNSFYNVGAQYNVASSVEDDRRGNDVVLTGQPFANPSADDFTASTELGFSYPGAFPGTITSQFMKAGAQQGTPGPTTSFGGRLSVPWLIGSG